MKGLNSTSASFFQCWRYVLEEEGKFKLENIRKLFYAAINNRLAWERSTRVRSFPIMQRTILFLGFRSFALKKKLPRIVFRKYLKMENFEY